MYQIDQSTLAKEKRNALRANTGKIHNRHRRAFKGKDGRINRSLSSPFFFRGWLVHLDGHDQIAVQVHVGMVPVPLCVSHRPALAPYPEGVVVAIGRIRIVRFSLPFLPPLLFVSCPLLLVAEFLGRDDDLDRRLARIERPDALGASVPGFLACDGQVRVQVVALSPVQGMLRLFYLKDDLDFVRLGELCVRLSSPGSLSYVVDVRGIGIGDREGGVHHANPHHGRQEPAEPQHRKNEDKALIQRRENEVAADRRPVPGE
mmetsp:Transcript_15311/g.34705  ORF Transcript_15311/g.34705 Transcript_15311/m.34705 type:complete len:260 (-) Transcript_15311:354-1133(-)